MPKPLSLSLAFAVLLTGCSAFKTSQTWRNVVDHRADRLADVSGKSTYPDRLHKALAAQNVEHKVVTYQYRYKTRLREEAVGTGKAVFYRDAATPNSPWWVMDENTGFPVWVPNESLDRQVSFFVRRNAEVLAQQDFPADGSGKSFDSAPTLAAPNTAPALLAKARKPELTMIARTKAKPAAPVALAASTRAGESPASRPEWLGSLEHRFDEMFRTTHGTEFDRKSSSDRQKMAELRHTATARSAEL